MVSTLESLPSPSSSLLALADEFVRHGYVVLRGLCPTEMIETMRMQALVDLADGVGPVEYEAEVGYDGAPASVDEPGGRTVRRLLDSLNRGSIYRQWALSTELTTVVRLLLAELQVSTEGDEKQDARRIMAVRAHHNCIMTKQPDYSSSTGWHQDIRYWSYERPDLVNAWTALGEESSNNGGMRLIPGSHRHDFDDACFDAERFFRTDYAPNQAWLDRAVQMDMQAGDVLFFHARLLHSAGRNFSDERKLSLVLSYRDSSNSPLPDSRSAAKDDLDAGPVYTSSERWIQN